ncbi:phytoene desaturase family protein [Peredibacter sp. HCB2-198]|uniref:phytoene desaturase family protein n=1 Tax=Peredibacter sp. HCB2-198 TaxID=3383025 RepID=UPI0038B5CE56
MTTVSTKYDAIVIGAGMSGLAAGIRLAMFDKKVVVLEKHSIPGGLNSYYQRRNFDKGGIRQFDVGLHALTNFIKKGEKGKPFSKLLKQLRLSYDDFKLCPQTHSKISFPGVELKFSNDFELLKNEVHEKFPHQIDAFNKLVEKVRTFDELNLNQGYSSSRDVLKQLISDELLIEMLLCPLLIYGSAWEDDMDFAQFVIMFKSLYFEGFSRPEGGVRTIIALLMKKLEEAGGEIRFKAPVNEILTNERGEAIGVNVGGEVLEAPVILSSIGYPETVKITQGMQAAPRVGAMTFLESIFVFDKKIPQTSNDSTIVFYNNAPQYAYRPATNYFDATSAVVCFPDNYEAHKTEGEGTIRITYMANYHQWRELNRTSYDEMKDKVSANALELVQKLTPGFDGKLLFKDIFSPMTIERYTWHLNGTVYGSIDKTRDGRTPVKNLFIIGTDQGFLGIVGSMLSGISMANLHGLMGADA